MNKIFVKGILKYYIDSGEVKIKTGPFGTQLHASDYVEKGTPVINVRNIGYGRIKTEKLEYINEETVQRLSSHLLKYNDIVFGRKGAVDRHALIGSNQQGWFQGSDCLRIRIKSRSLDPHFLSYYFLTENHKKWMLAQCSHGATMASLNQDIISRISLNLPNIQIQQKIASILSSYDDLIENNTRRIEILEQMAKLVYEEWFVKFRFPGHENVKMVPSDLGEIPEGWKVKAFSEVIDVNPMRRLSKGKLATKVSMADLNTWQSWINSWQKEEYKSGPKFKNGDTLFARITPCLENGKTAFVNFLSEGETAFGSTELIVFGPKVIESGPYIFFLSRSEYIRGTTITAMTGTSGRQRVPNDCFDHLLICVPPNEIVWRFNEIVMPLFELIKNNSKKSVCLKKARDLLLPKLISGEIDVSDLDIHIRNEYNES
jgi:type I restriction enzyme, S subunit